jgi:hypothetical protein
VWARFGFKPTPSDWPTVKEHIRRRLAAVPIEISLDAKQGLDLALRNEDASALWGIADLNEPINGIPLGRWLLSGSAWEGILDLDDVDAMDRLEEYLARKLTENNQCRSWN